MSFAHVDSILETYEGTPARKMVLLALGKHANGRGECFPKIATLARLTCQSRRTVQRALNELEEEGTISRVMPRGKVTRYALQLDKGCQSDTGDTVTQEGCQSDTGGVSGCHGRGDTVTPESVNESVTESKNIVAIVDYLNERAGKRFKPTAKETQSLIRARFAEGFTVEDFKAVIDNRAAAWRGDRRMAEYLRPETLFGTKFESYLNAEPAVEDDEGWD